MPTVWSYLAPHFPSDDVGLNGPRLPPLLSLVHPEREVSLRTCHRAKQSNEGRSGDRRNHVHTARAGDGC